MPDRAAREGKAEAAPHTGEKAGSPPFSPAKLIWIKNGRGMTVRLPETRPAPGETVVITRLKPSKRGLRAVLFWLSALACGSGPGEAQGRVDALAKELCERPPMGLQRVEQLKRRSDYGRLLEELADACPDVAMLFLDFEVGTIDDRAETPRFDAQQFIAPLRWPEPADRNY